MRNDIKLQVRRQVVGCVQINVKTKDFVSEIFTSHLSNYLKE